MKKLLLLSILTTLCVPGLLFAQNAEPSAVLAYYEDDTQIEVLDSAREPVQVYFGMALQPGDTVRTNSTIAELQLEPNGSIIKLSENTVFTVDELQRNEKSSNKFSMAAGKMRAIAARAGIGNRYEVSTPSAVCGVRGTDFGLIAIPEEEERAFVAQGVVEFVQKSSQSAVTLTQGMTADALADTFEAVRLSQEQLQELLQNLQFQQLDPGEVPGHQVAAEEEEEGEDEADEPEEETEEGNEPVEPEDAEVPEAEVTAAGGETAEASGQGGGRDSKLARALGEILGFEVGTVTMQGRTYSKAVIRPEFEIGKLRLGIYLPIVYNNDLFDYSQWYRPEGNNEWSFGTDYDWSSEPAEAAQDALIDLALKIHYLEWGEQRDPFYLKLGNLHNMTLGHGTIMENFANDLDFPTVRRVGLNMGIDRKKSGFEMAVNDVARPEIFGGRIYFRPIGRFAMGLTSVVDIDPLGQADPANTDLADVDSMRFFAFGGDLELPIFENDVISIIPFADVAAMVPQRNGEMQWDVVYNSDGSDFDDTFRNYGLTSGIFGNLLFVDYELEWRYYNGVFRPTFFNTTYERTRGTLVVETEKYLDGLESGSTAPDYDDSVMGIYGSAHTVLFNLVDLKAGYMWPWRSLDELEDKSNFNDEFSLAMYLLPEAAKLTKVYGGIEYSRTNFVPAFVDDDLSLFDAYTQLKGEIVYPIAPTMDIAAIISTAVSQDENGNIEYDADGDPKIVPSVTIESRIHF